MPQVEVEIVSLRPKTGRWATYAPAIMFRPETRYSVEEDCFDASFMKKIEMPKPEPIPAIETPPAPMPESVPEVKPKPSAWEPKKGGK